MAWLASGYAARGDIDVAFQMNAWVTGVKSKVNRRHDASNYIAVFHSGGSPFILMRRERCHYTAAQVIQRSRIYNLI